jgi:hypothetical protein
LWSTGEQTQTIEVDASGTYIVTVTQNGCEGGDTLELIVNPLPQPAIIPAGPVNACAGDNITLDAGGGYDFYTWSNGDLIQTTQTTVSGTYIVEVLQDGCAGADTVEILFTPIPHATITPSGTHNLCSGDTITLDAGTGFDAYLWSTGDSTQTASVSATGTYNVTVTLNGCTGAATSPVNVFSNITPSATITQLGTGNGQAVLEASPAGASYQWLFQSQPNGPYTLESTTTQLDTVTCGDIGEYHTVVVTLNGCSDTSAQFTVVCVGIQPLEAEIKFSMMPNPASDVINVSYNLNQPTPIAISIIDITGRKIMDVIKETQGSGEYRQSIRLSGLSSGIYFLNFATDSGMLNSKFIKD